MLEWSPAFVWLVGLGCSVVLGWCQTLEWYVVVQCFQALEWSLALWSSGKLGKYTSERLIRFKQVFLKCDII